MVELELVMSDLYLCNYSIHTNLITIIVSTVQQFKI